MTWSHRVPTIPAGPSATQQRQRGSPASRSAIHAAHRAWKPSSGSAGAVSSLRNRKRISASAGASRGAAARTLARSRLILRSGHFVDRRRESPLERMRDDLVDRLDGDQVRRVEGHAEKVVEAEDHGSEDRDQDTDLHSSLDPAAERGGGFDDQIGEEHGGDQVERDEGGDHLPEHPGMGRGHRRVPPLHGIAVENGVQQGPDDEDHDRSSNEASSVHAFASLAQLRRGLTEDSLRTGGSGVNAGWGGSPGEARRRDPPGSGALLRGLTNRAISYA